MAKHQPDTMQTKAGYSLVEMLIYIAVLAVIFLLVVNTMLSFTDSYHELAAARAAEHAGIDALERMTREIRDADDVNAGQSVLGTHPGALALTKSNGAVITLTRFYIENNSISMSVDGTPVGPLTGSSTAVTNLVFTELAGARSKAVKIDLTVAGTDGKASTTRTYHSTVVLKGS